MYAYLYKLALNSRIRLNRKSWTRGLVRLVLSTDNFGTVTIFQPLSWSVLTEPNDFLYEEISQSEGLPFFNLRVLCFFNQSSHHCFRPIGNAEVEHIAFLSMVVNESSSVTIYNNRHFHHSCWIWRCIPGLARQQLLKCLVLHLKEYKYKLKNCFNLSSFKFTQFLFDCICPCPNCKILFLFTRW